MIKKILNCLFGKKIPKWKLPKWSHGLECDICKKSFINADEHYKYVLKKDNYRKHIGLIPKLKK